MMKAVYIVYMHMSLSGLGGRVGDVAYMGFSLSVTMELKHKHLIILLDNLQRFANEIH